MSLFDRFIDNAPALRCSKAEAVGHITAKSFVRDAGYGDCPMQITYEFSDASGQIVAGKHVATESSYYAVNTGDRILIPYLEANPKTNAPVDSLGIIRSVSEDPKNG